MELLNHVAKYHFQEQGEVQGEGESKWSDFVFSESMLDEFLY